MVLVFHLVCCDVPLESTGWLYALGVSTFQFWAGVDLFFVLSGFFIFSTLIANEGRPGFERRYFVSRFFRIVPAYVILLLGYFYVPYLIHDNYLKGLMFDTTTPNVVYLFFGQAWSVLFTHDNGAGFVGVTWSLSAEVFLYVLAAAVVALFKRNRIGILLGLAFISWMLRVFLSVFLHDPFACFFVPVCRMDGFMLGGVVAILLRDGVVGALSARQIGWLRGLVGACLVFFVGTTLAVVDSKGRFAAVADFAVLGVLFASILLLTLAAGQRAAAAQVAGGAFSRAFMVPLSYLGVISYSVYIFHIPIHYLFNYLCGLDYISLVYPGAWTRLFFEVLVTIGFCSLTTFLIEQPMIRAGQRINSRGRPASSAEYTQRHKSEAE
jgi:peptidoglycan/LPS O-acetylase OafA/YrhL